MDVKPLWSIMFFSMLLTLGIGSMIGTFEAVRTTIIDLQIIPLRKEFLTGKLYSFGLVSLRTTNKQTYLPMQVS